jgi:hypothetical protein
MVWQRGGEDVPVRITTAATSPQEDISARQRRYVISMTIRTLCFLGAVVVGQGWLRWVLVAGAVLLPYVAVVMANAVGTKSEELALRDADFRRGELGAGSENGPRTH